MVEFFRSLLDSRPFMPHGHCYLYESGAFWLVVVSDLLIALAYFSIPVALTVFIRRRPGLKFAGIYWLFVAFIALCGLSHVMMVIGMWVPLYRLEGLIKLLTGVVSLVTAGVLWIYIPKALEIPTPGEMEATKRQLELESARRQTEEAAHRMKSEYIATLSHEIRTPMTCLIGMIELLNNKGMVAQHEDYLRIAQQSGEHLLMLMNDNLDMSRIEAGYFKLLERPFGLSAVVSATQDLMAVRAAGKDLELEATVVPGTPERWIGDQTRVTQILINLAYNAIKFTEHGSVRLHARARLDPSGEPVLIFEVTDTGRGIDPERREAIFEPFTQGDDEVAAKFGGSGLGLAISSRLAEMMHGGISVESEVGKGSCFTVELGLKAADDASAPPRGPEDTTCD